VYIFSVDWERKKRNVVLSSSVSLFNFRAVGRRGKKQKYKYTYNATISTCIKTSSYLFLLCSCFFIPNRHCLTLTLIWLHEVMTLYPLLGQPVIHHTSLSLLCYLPDDLLQHGSHVVQLLGRKTHGNLHGPVRLSCAHTHTCTHTLHTHTETSRQRPCECFMLYERATQRPGGSGK